MGVGETDHDSAFLNPPYCKRPLYGGLGNLAEEGSKVIAMDISSMSTTWRHITSSSTCSNYLTTGSKIFLSVVSRSEGTPGAVVVFP